MNNDVETKSVQGKNSLLAEQPAERRGQRTMLTIFGMAIGGWMSGWIFDQSGSYQIAFLNGILWNVFNLTILVWLFIRMRRGHAVI